MDIDSETGQTLKDQLIDLYIGIELFNSNEVLFYIFQINKFDQSAYDSKWAELSKLSPFQILKYIRCIVEALLDNREDSTNINSEYEPVIQKLEEETRNHIGIEQQLKLHIDTLQEKMDESTNTIEELKKEVKIKSEECNKLNGKVNEFTEKNKELQKQIEDLEKQKPSIPTIDDNENKNEVESIKTKGDSCKKVPYNFNLQNNDTRMKKTPVKSLDKLQVENLYHKRAKSQSNYIIDSRNEFQKQNFQY